MPLFRFHRGGLAESLKTTVIVRTFNELVKTILYSDPFIEENPIWGARFKISAYPDKDSNFDIRIGWYTHIVSANLYKENEMHTVGFLSEPFWESVSE